MLEKPLSGQELEGANLCGSVHDLCLAAVSHCLVHGGAHAEVAHVTLLLDCGQIAQTARSFLLRGSADRAITCRACAELCDVCAASCDRVDPLDHQLRQVADACRRTAGICREIAVSAEFQRLAR